MTNVLNYNYFKTVAEKDTSQKPSEYRCLVIISKSRAMTPTYIIYLNVDICGSSISARDGEVSLYLSYKNWHSLHPDDLRRGGPQFVAFTQKSHAISSNGERHYCHDIQDVLNELFKIGAPDMLIHLVSGEL